MIKDSIVTMSAALISFQEEFDKTFSDRDTILANQLAYNVLASVYGDLIKHRFDLERLMHDKTLAS